MPRSERSSSSELLSPFCPVTSSVSNTVSPDSGIHCRDDSGSTPSLISPLPSLSPHTPTKRTFSPISPPAGNKRTFSPTPPTPPAISSKHSFSSLPFAPAAITPPEAKASRVTFYSPVPQTLPVTSISTFQPVSQNSGSKKSQESSDKKKSDKHIVTTKTLVSRPVNKSFSSRASLDNNSSADVETNVCSVVPSETNPVGKTEMKQTIHLPETQVTAVHIAVYPWQTLLPSLTSTPNPVENAKNSSKTVTQVSHQTSEKSSVPHDKQTEKHISTLTNVINEIAVKFAAEKSLSADSRVNSTLQSDETKADEEVAINLARAVPPKHLRNVSEDDGKTTPKVGTS